jgi:hypothetical protein
MTSPAPTRSHFGNPFVTAGCSKRRIVPSIASPTIITKDSQTTQIHESAERVTHLSWDIPGCDWSCGSPMYSTQSMVNTTKPQGIVTPDHSFGEREHVSRSTTMPSFQQLDLPTYLPSSGSFHAKSARRISVGLPTEYLTRDRTNSLISTMSEELQDFDEFFKSPRNHHDGSDCMDVDDESNKTSPSSSMSKEQGRPTSRDSRNTELGHKQRRLRNRAMGNEDFTNLVLKHLQTNN